MSVPNTPHDALFRALMDDPVRARALIRDLLPKAIASRLADELPTLLDGSYIDEELRESRSDRLFSVALKDGRTALLYILLEHKSTPDPRTPLQTFGYRGRIWDRYAGSDPAKLRRLPPIIPLVLYHGKSEWHVPTSIFDCIDADEELLEHLRDFSYVVCDLGPIPDALLSSHEEVRVVLMTMKYVFRDTELEELLATILTGLSEGTLFEIQVIRYILQTYRGITSPIWAKVVNRVKPYRESEMVSLAAEEWMQQGEARGIAKGKAEGKAEDILIALETRFGQVSPEVEARVRKSDPEQLDGIFRRSLTAPTLDDVFADDWHH